MTQPITLHPGNPHYLLWRGEPTILLTSGEHYGALLNLDFDYGRYFRELQAHGLNHTRTFSGVYRETPASFAITDNTLAPRQHRYVCPWARSDQPGYAHGGEKFDLTQWEPEYFARLHAFMSQARDSGIVVELTLFCPFYREDMWRVSPLHAANNVNGVGQCPRAEVYTLKHGDLLALQLGVTRKLVGELRDYDNLYYEVCNEPYFGGVTTEWQHQIIDAIVETEQDFPAQHLISLNIANGSEHVEQPHPAVSIFNFHYCAPPDTVALNYALHKVIGENETGFRGRADVLYRTEAWDFLLAGGGLFNHLDYSFTAQHPDGTFRDYESPGGGSPELRHQLGILKAFLDSLPLTQMQPDNKVLQRVSPNLTASALVQHGQDYAVYLHVPLPKAPEHVDQHLQDDLAATVTLDLPAGTYQAEWVNTETGAADRRETFRHPGDTRELASPLFSNDMALRVTRR